MSKKMISKQMYRLLTEIPHAPITTSFQEIADKKILDISLLKTLLNDAVKNKYIAYPSRVNPYSDILTTSFSLTESGQIAIEEYKGTKYNSKLSTWAIIIAGLSLVVSFIALFVR